jgi:hypothetical protein
MDLEPSAADLQSPGVGAWIGALCAAVRKRDLELFKKLEEGLPFGKLLEEEMMRLGARANWQTVIPKEALMDFAKLSNIDLKSLDQ